MRTILLLLTLLYLPACSTDDSSDHYLAQAKGYIAEQEYLAATIELQNALQLDGNFAEARWLLGKIYLDRGEILEAENQLLRAQKLGWEANDIRPAIAKTQLAQGKFADVLAMEHKDLNATASARILSHQAKAALSQNETAEARRLVAAALEKEPLLREASLASATIAIHEGNPDIAINFLDAILEVAPDSGEAWWLKGQALLRKGKLEEAQSALDQSIAYSNIAFADRISRAMINLQLQDYEAARADAGELLRLAPNNAVANYIQGVVLFHNREYLKAIRALSLAQPAAAQFPQILHLLSTAYLIEKDLDLAGRFAYQLVALVPEDSNSRKLLAAIQVLQDKSAEAQEILRPTLDQNPDDVAALNIMANALLLDDQADSGLVMYARIAQLQPDWCIVPLRLEAVLVTSGPDGDMNCSPELNIDDDENFPQEDILLILNLLGKQEFESAIGAAKSYQLQDMKSLSPYLVLGRVYLAAGQPEAAREAFQSALKRVPGDVTASLSLAQLALKAGDSEAARSYYQTILEHHPDDLATLLHLSSLEARENDREAVAATLKQAIATHPKQQAPRLGLASYYLGAGKPEKIAPLFTTLSDMQRESPGVLQITGLAQMAQKQYESAVDSFQKLVVARPRSAQYRYLLATAVHSAGDPEKAKQELEHAISLNAKHVPSLVNLARIARRENNQLVFAEYLATLTELAPDVPDVMRLRALSARENGNLTEALSISQQAFDQAPSTQTVLILSTHQKAAGNNADASNTLQQWLKNHPTDTAVRLALANYMDLDNKPQNARVQYLVILKQDPDNIIALNNLAWNLRYENPKKALEYIRRAIQKAPDTATLLDSLAVIEYLNGDHTAAQSNIGRALAMSPDDLSMRYHQAMIEAALGERERAIASLEKLVLIDTSDFPEQAEAQALLNKLRG